MSQTTISLTMADATYAHLQSGLTLMLECQGITPERTTKLVKVIGILPVQTSIHANLPSSISSVQFSGLSLNTLKLAFFFLL